ncbi:Nucleotidyltransferase domain-containing protein [Mucilaginibacter pineti]|uniref:Nucleotidyltransferase domain-containing protein n=1 Tax=Mucilaginibacter pineti TaxID=1391627 RepID=A0A1G7L322_9SPHI|nr:nucleotidyltransferase domain-containing protein [Mucilaginibacter pineti]SDF43888.1 Nucleotidyltransferase domain-containing protein [Mucilaginibacter pineti]
MAQNNYRDLINNVRNRLDPENLIIEKSIREELASISYSDVLEYVRYAMNGVEPAYTQRSKDAGENVKTHLTNGGITNASYRYQGSIMTNTHVKGYSDIDLLVISDKFYSVDVHNVKGILNESSRQIHYSSNQIFRLQVENAVSSYNGNSLDDLRKLRLDSEYILKNKYIIHDLTKPKSIKITNSGLRRDVDIVIANWYDDITSVINGKGDNRGIQIYNKDYHIQGKADYPFISIERINNKSTITSGRLKKMIRFLKNLKGKSTLAIELSSFDFNAICYDIDQAKYQNLIFHQLVPVLYTQLKTLATNQTAADNLVSVDGREYIFRNQPHKMESLKNLVIEIESIVADLKSNRVLL